MDVPGVGVGAGGDDVGNFLIDEVEGGAVVKAVRGGEFAGFEEFVKRGAAVGFAIVVGRATAGKETETGHGSERTPRIGQGGFEPADGSGADATKHGAVIPSLAKEGIHSAHA